MKQNNFDIRTLILGLVAIASLIYAFTLGIMSKDAYYFTLLSLLAFILLTNALAFIPDVIKIIIVWILAIVTVIYSKNFVTNQSFIMMVVVMLLLGGITTFRIIAKRVNDQNSVDSSWRQ